MTDTSTSLIRDQIREDYDNIDIKTYTRWLNWKLNGKGIVVENLIEDLQDGHVLMSLARVLLKVEITAESGKSEICKNINVQKVLDAFEKDGVNLTGISASRVVCGEQTTILGLIWSIIRHFQIPDDNKELLIKWVRYVLKGYSDIVIVDDVLESWQNGLAFILLMFVYRPNVVNIAEAQKMTVVDRLEYAFYVAEKEFGIHRLFEPIDVEQGNLYEKAMLMYLSALYEVLRNFKPVADYDKWKECVAELEGILDGEEVKFDPNSDIEKEYSNLERLAQETKDSGATVENICKPKLATISSDGNALIMSRELDPSDETKIAEKIVVLTERVQHLDTTVRITKEKVREAVLEYIVKTLNELSVRVKEMRETAKSLTPAANDLPGVRVQITTLKSLGQQHSSSAAKLQNTEEKVKKMVDAGVMTEQDSAGMFGEKNQIQNIADAIDDAKPKLMQRYIELLKREIERRKEWMDAHEDEIIKTEIDFKDFSEFKAIYLRNQELVTELNNNSVQVLIKEAENFDGIEPELNEELIVLNERWTKMDVALTAKNELNDKLMADWSKYREQQLIFLNWIDEKYSELAREKDQVNLTDTQETIEHITKLMNLKNGAESEGEIKEKNLREAGEDLIRHLPGDFPAADEICKQTEEIVSVKLDFLKDLRVRIEKIESSEEKTRDLYNDFDDVIDWLDTAESLIENYENHEKETADDGSTPGQNVLQDGEVDSNKGIMMAPVVEKIMVNFEKLAETDSKVKHVNTLGSELKEEIAEECKEGVDAKLEAFNQRYNTVTERIRDFKNTDDEESPGCSGFTERIRHKLIEMFTKFSSSSSYGN